MGSVEYIFVDLISLFLILMAGSQKTLYRLKSAQTDNLFFMLWSIVAVLVCDIGATIISGRVFPGSAFWVCFFNTFYFLFQALYAFTWLLLAMRLSARRRAADRILSRICFVSLLIEAALVVLNLFTKWFFVIDKTNHYLRMPHFPLMLLPFFLCFAVGIIQLVLLAAHAQTKAQSSRFLTYLFYLCLPVIGGLLQIIYPGIPWLWSLATFSLLFLVIDVQQQEIGENRVHDAIRMMGAVFYKIDEINLTSDSYRIIKNDLPEKYDTENQKLSISEKFRFLAESDLILEEDKDDFRRNFNSAFMKKFFDSGEFCLRVKYRRLTANGYRWVATEIIRCPDYSPQNCALMLYVRDIHDEYIEELRQSKQLEHSLNHDALTGAHSHHCYRTRINELSAENTAVGIVYADLNNLKGVNDTQGHDAGDRYLKDFSARLSSIFGEEYCYRISGDEFAAIVENTDKQQFLAMTEKLREAMTSEPIATASFGTAWCGNTAGIVASVKDAEDEMYRCKDAFYAGHPGLQRRTFTSR